jgi:hypothetical protein
MLFLTAYCFDESVLDKEITELETTLAKKKAYRKSLGKTGDRGIIPATNLGDPYDPNAWPLDYKFTCAKEGSDCKSSNRRRRGITAPAYRRREGCGKACKVITDTDPYSDTTVDLRFVDMNHNYKVGTYSFTAKSDGPHEFTSVKYGSEVDGTKFSGDNAAGESADWRDADCGCGSSDFCMAGLNYDNKRGFCGTGASGWSAGTDFGRCRQLTHKCERINIYYFRSEGATGNWANNAGQLANRGSAVAPITDENNKLYEETFTGVQGGRRRRGKTGNGACLNKYTFALKKWSLCTATNVTDDGVIIARSCAVEKRCPCISCEKESDACGALPNEPCDCQNLPESVSGSLASRCGAY